MDYIDIITNQFYIPPRLPPLYTTLGLLLSFYIWLLGRNLILPRQTHANQMKRHESTYDQELNSIFRQIDFVSLLPPEIWTHIFELSSVKMIKRVSLVSRLFRLLCREILFVNVTLSAAEGDEKWSWFLESSSIYPSIRSLSITGDGSDDTILANPNIAAVFSRLTRLNRLELTRCHIPDYLADTMFTSSHLRHVSIDTCRMNQSYTEPPTEKQTSIQSLLLRYADPFTGSIYRRIFDKHCQDLESLDIDDYSITLAVWAMRTRVKKLRYLTVSAWDYSAAERLLLHCPNLISLDLETRFFPDSSVVCKPGFPRNLQVLTCNLKTSLELLPFFTSLHTITVHRGHKSPAGSTRALVANLEQRGANLISLEIPPEPESCKTLFERSMQTFVNLRHLKVELLELIVRLAFLKTRRC